MEHARSKDFSDGVYQWVDTERYMILHPTTGMPLQHYFASSGGVYGTYDEIVTLMLNQGVPSFVAVKLDCIKAFRVKE